MSTTVDERVVSMQFDNKRFEQGAAETIGTLSKLKQSLNFSGSVKGLEEVNTTAKRMDFSGIGNGIETVKAKFSALQIVGITALQNITNTAVNAGKRIISSLTIDPVKTGLQEYETQLNAIQTILANTESKGSTLEDVNAALDELNTYADKTIYNFTEMTRNIGTFTAAGVDLDTSVSAIKGIANLAAVSGSTSQQASTAMYQLSQALASGTVKLMDWNSVVNAGMGGQVFQDALKQTAKVHGIAIDDIIEKNGSFRESLKEGWLTAEILTDTLNKFTGDLTKEQILSMGYTEQQAEEILKLGVTANDAATKVKTFTQLMDTLKEGAQSGWAQTWRIIIGDFEEAKELWTGVSDVLGGVINTMSEARNSLLSGALDSGWDKLMSAGIMDEEGYSTQIKKIAKEHGIAIDEMIKEEGSLEKALQKGFSEGTISSDVLSQALSKLNEAYADCSDEELENLGYTRQQVEALKELNEKVQNGSISMDEFAEQIGKLSGREMLIESFSNVFKGLVSVIKPIKDAFREIFPPTTSAQLYNIIDTIRQFTSRLKLSDEQADKVKRTFKGLFAVVDIIATVFKTLAKSIFRVIGSFSGLGNGVLDVTASIGDFLVKVRNSVKETGSFANILKNITDGIVNFITTVKNKVDSSGIFGGFLKILKIVWNTVKTIFGEIGKVIGDAFSGLGTGDTNIFDILTTVLAGGAIYKLIDFIKSLKETTSGFSGILDVLKKPFEGIGELIGSVTDALSSFQDKLRAETIKTLATSLLILAAAVLILALIPKDKLVSAMSAVALSMTILIGGLTVFSKLNKKTLSSVTAMITLSASLLILAFALKKLGSMEWDEIGRGLVAMTGAMTILMGALALAALIGKIGGTKSAKNLMKIAIPLLLVSATLKLLGSMEWDEIGRGLTAMTGAFVILMGALALTALISKIGSVKGTLGLLAISASLITVAISLKIMGTMEWPEIGRGLSAMGGALAILLATLTLMSLITKIGARSGVIQMMGLTVTLMGLALTLKVLGTMSWDEIGRGLAAMAGALGVLTGILALLALVSKISGAGSMLASSAAILIMAGSLVVLTGVLAVLGNMDKDKIAKGLITIAAALAIIGIAGFALSSVVPTILALSAALIALGVSLTLIGVGVSLISVGLTTLITAIVGGSATIVATVTSLVKSLIELIPLLLISVAEGIIGFCAVIEEGAPIIGQAIASLLIAAIDACVQVIPELAHGLFTIIVGVLDSMVEFVPQILNSIVNLIVSVLESLSKFIPKLVQTAIKVLAEFFDGIIDSLKNIDSDQLLKTVLAVGIIAAILLALSALASLIPSAMVGVLGMGVVVAELAIVLAAIGKLASIPGLQDLIAGGGNLLQTIGTAIGQFIGGIIGGLAKGVTSSLPAIGTDLSNFMKNLTPFINGIKLIDKATLDSAKTLASLILVITASSIIDSLTSWFTGGTSMADFGSELAEFGKGIRGFADEVKGIDSETVKAAAEAGKNLGQMAKSIPTSGGLWNLIKGENKLTGFADQLGGFGKGIKDFANAVKGVNAESVKEAAEAGKSLGTMASKLPTKGGLWNAIKGENGMSTFSSQLAKFGEAIKNFVTSMANVGNVNEVSAKVTALNKCLTSFTTSGLTSMISAINNAKSVVFKAMNDMIQNAVSAVMSRANSLSIAGKTLMAKFIEAVASYKTKVNKAFTDVASSAINAIKTKNNYNKFYAAGEYLVTGLASGIEDNASTAISKATAMANAVNSALKSVFKINSPSKVAYEDGLSLGEGLILGLDESGTSVYKASSNMAESTIEGMRKALTTASDLIENSTDAQPTIRPTVDLSNVIAGANAVSGMFGLRPSVGVLSTVGSINSSMNNIQNRSKYDVVSAIKDLSTKLQNASAGNTYNINGITYDDGSNLQMAIETIVRAARIERRT